MQNESPSALPTRVKACPAGNDSLPAIPLSWTTNDAVVVDRCIPPAIIGRREWSRKIWHIAPAISAFLLPWAPDYGHMAENLGQATIRLLVLGTITGLTATMLIFTKSLVRPEERSFPSAVIGYALLVLLPLLAFPNRLELGMTVLAVIAIGDGAAGLIGMRYGGERLAWNRSKTWTGTAAFVLCGIPAATLAYWLGSHPRVSGGGALMLASVTVIVAAIAESWESDINDNIRVGATAVVSVLLGQGFLFGWH